MAKELPETYKDIKDVFKGPWSDEPDRELFKAHGFQCLLNRNWQGVWCGYVGLTPSHPWYGKEYSKIPVDCHGGLTYGQSCQGEICHPVEPGEEEHLWWIGFDCGHAFDIAPWMEWFRIERMGELFKKTRNIGNFREEYRNYAYAKAETLELAHQCSRPYLVWFLEKLENIARWWRYRYLYGWGAAKIRERISKWFLTNIL